jgi:hypothetical protein
MKKIILLVAVLVAMGSFSCAYALENSRQGTIVDVKGVVEVQTASESWKAAQKGMILAQGDSIRTQKDSTALIGIEDEGKMTTVEMKQNSKLQLAVLLGGKEAPTQTTLLDLSMGEILVKAQKVHSEKSKFEVKTPTSVVGIRGTTFSVAVETTE